MASRKQRIGVVVGSAAALVLIGAPSALAYSSIIDGALTGFESSRWKSVGGSSAVHFTGCSSVGVGPNQNTTHISQWKDVFGPDQKQGDSARFSNCFKGSSYTSKTSRSITSGAIAYFRIDKINGEVSGSGLDVKKVVVYE
ncbi:hypothetical protein [Streptomyces gobiensis]|uniref:hypothetical protein n=1 Tax=Streptomyces gobiensis TaxID=2875706 RepID=UPI001E58ABF6|nr:hypothetical protein [Streptomyces gobiensis]UGY92831.1 hypothetical protein test1122_14720 [Streptomyces gobiensis]